MRNGQNKRMRGRNRGKGGHHHQNPLSRVYESNGPDVKIRGTASHIAEKYVQLARDAQSSGDPVAAENYYQHAEHYFRLIAAAQEQLRQSQPYYQQQQPQQGGNMADDSYAAEVEVSVDRDGQISDPVWQQGSGNSRWDDSVRAAIAAVTKMDRPPPTNFPPRVIIRFDVQQETEPVLQ